MLNYRFHIYPTREQGQLVAGIAAARKAAAFLDRERRKACRLPYLDNNDFKTLTCIPAGFQRFLGLGGPLG